MGKNKLSKFSDMATFPHVFQFPFDRLEAGEFNIKGEWNKQFFRNANPIILELGCGKGEYAVGLGRLFPDRNFIGVDIKGARMWSGAKESLDAGMTNVAFLRTHIEWINSFFAPGEVAEIWLTFPDPQMKKPNKRLTSPRFMQIYRQILSPQGIIHLKTDSRFLYDYTSAMIEANGLPLLFHTDNLHAADEPELSITTAYEQQWMQRGIDIKYLRFVCTPKDFYVEPDIEIEQDDYRSFNRSKRSALTHAK
jgi:tRNA (guanine-N7-)-methyltransferase